jgi:hypothetical protein
MDRRDGEPERLKALVDGQERRATDRGGDLQLHTGGCPVQLENERNVRVRV